MESPSEFIHPDRLMAAVDALYRAQDELGDAGLPGYPPDLLGSANQPQSLVDFTKAEIEEATLFLARAGLIQAVRRKRAS